MKPVAIDLGRAFWVMARTDINGRPEVAGVGDGGLISAVISEREQQILFGEYYVGEEGPPPIRNFFQLLSGSPLLRNAFGSRVRDHLDGGVEIFLGGGWRGGVELLGEMLHTHFRVVKENLSPQSPLPVVAAIPPEVEVSSLFALRKAFSLAGLSLSGWCPTPLALALCDGGASGFRDGVILTALLERGALTFGLVEVVERFPHLRLSRVLNWDVDMPLPVEQARQLFDELLLLSDEKAAVRASDIDLILIAGEESWIPHLQGILNERCRAGFRAFERPQFSVAMGASLLAERLGEGFYLSPVVGETSLEQISLKGITLPEARLQVQGGGRDVLVEVDMMGRFDVPVLLRAGKQNQLELSAHAIDGRQFSQKMNVLQSSSAPVFLRMDPEKTTQNPGKQHILIESIGILLESSGEWLSITSPFCELPVQKTIRVESARLGAGGWVTEGPVSTSAQPMCWGWFGAKELAALLIPEGVVNIELTCDQGSQFELAFQIEGQAKREYRQVFRRDERKHLVFDQPKKPKGGHRTSRGLSGREAMSNDSSESTQPDMEVPAEMIDAAEAMSFEGGLTQQTPSPRQKPQPQRGREADLFQEPQFSIDPSAGLGGFSAEGDGSTMVLSRDALFKQKQQAPGLVTPRMQNPRGAQQSTPYERSPGSQSSPSYDRLPGHHSSSSREMLSSMEDDDVDPSEATVIGTNILLTQSPPKPARSYDRNAGSGSFNSTPSGSYNSSPSGSFSNTPSGSYGSTPSTSYGGGASSSNYQHQSHEEIMEVDDSMVDMEQIFAEMQVPEPEPVAVQADIAPRLRVGVTSEKLEHTQEVVAIEESMFNEMGGYERSQPNPVTQKPQLPPPAQLPSSRIPSVSRSSQELPSARAHTPEERAAPKPEAIRRTPNRAEKPRGTSSSSLDGQGELIAQKLSRAHELALEARELVDEVQNLSIGLETISEHQALVEELLNAEDDLHSLEAGDRREARKIMELARSIAEVESTRLPSSSRKTLLRLAKDLENRLQDDDGRLPMRLALQLANRLFETIRRDLRPW